MRYFPQAVKERLDAGLIAARGLLRFDFGGGTYCFWTGSEPVTIEGRTYQPGGIIEVDALPGQFGMDAVGLEIKLPEYADQGLTPEVMASIEAEDYHQRPVTVSDVFIDPETRQILTVEPLYRGYVDTLEHEEGPDANITVRCESRALDNAREGYRMRSNADQQLISAGDRGFEHAEVAGKQELYWGRKAPK